MLVAYVPLRGRGKNNVVILRNFLVYEAVQLGIFFALSTCLILIFMVCALLDYIETSGAKHRRA